MTSFEKILFYLDAGSFLRNDFLERSRNPNKSNNSSILSDFSKQHNNFRFLNLTVVIWYAKACCFMERKLSVNRHMRFHTCRRKIFARQGNDKWAVTRRHDNWTQWPPADGHKRTERGPSDVPSISMTSDQNQCWTTTRSSRGSTATG